MKVFYEKCVNIYDDYRAVVPSYAPAALSFYLLLIMVPIFSLLAIGTSLLNIDLTFISTLIKQVIVEEYAVMLIDVLQSKSVNTVAVVTMGISLYTVSRGIGNVYEISKNMYQQKEDEGIISYYIYTFKVTIFLILLLIGVIAVIAIGPLAMIFNFLYSLFGIKHIFLYFLMVFCLMSIYLIVPRIHIHHTDAFEGALVASALMLVLYYALNIYFQFADFQSVYGPLAAIVMVLFVFDWAAEVFYIGMYITNVLHRRREENGKIGSRN